MNSAKPTSAQLTLWINSDKGYNGIQKVANCYTQDSGITIAVETPENVTEKFEQQAAIDGGPDIFIWAHDRFGDWAQNDFIAAVTPSENIKNSIPKDFWASTTYNGQIYGYPLAVEGSTMLVNTDLVTGDTIDLRNFPLANITPLVWDYNNTYFSYGWLNAQGGYAFKKSANGWDKTDVGTDHVGMIKQAELLASLVSDEIVPQGVDYGVMDAQFKVGEAAMIINGPWSWADYSRAGINYEVRGYQINGNDTRPFSGVLAAAVNSSSSKYSAATTFIEDYLMSKAGMKAMNDDRALGLPTNIGFMADFSGDPFVMGLASVMLSSEPMPNIPEMGSFWSNMGPALTAITQGRLTATEALTDASQRIRNSD
jgi:maltose/maltodextrin transport system substrate-binding protein